MHMKIENNNDIVQSSDHAIYCKTEAVNRHKCCKCGSYPNNI